MCVLPHKWTKIGRCLSTLITAFSLAGLLAAPAFAETPAQERGWWQVPTVDLAYGPPLSIGFDGDGMAWIGTRGGVNTLRPGTAPGQFPLPDAEVEVVAVTAGPDGAMWLATDSATGPAIGVRVMWPDGRQSGYDVLDGLADNHVRDIAVGPAGDVWFATAGGLGRLSPDGSWGRFTRAAGLVDSDIYALAFDASGNLWIGTYGGVSRLSSDGTWTGFTVAEGLAGQWVRDVAVDHQGNVWCATGLGVSIFSPEGAWRTLTVADGLASNAVNALAPDDAGGIWFATNEGASYLAANDQWLTYNQEAGLLSNTVVDVAIDRQGQPWFATAGGLSVLVGGLVGAVADEPATATFTPTPPEPTATAAPAVAENPTAAPTAAPPATATAEPVAAEPARVDQPGVPAFVEIGFYVVFFLSIVGVGAMLRHIVMLRRQRRQPAATTQETRGRQTRKPEGVDFAWDEGLVPITLSDAEGEALAPEVAEALAELDGYQTPRSTSLVSPVPGSPLLPTADEIAAAIEVTPAQQPPASSTASEIRRKALESWLRRAAPEDIRDLMQEGTALARQGHKADAYDVFTTITRLAPEHAEAWLWKGGLAFHPRESVRCIQRALDLDPDNPRAREGLAWALARLSATEEGPLPE